MGEHAICYFSADYGTPLLLDGLVRSGIPIIAHVPGDVARNSTLVAGSKVVLHESRFDLARAMPAAGLAIHAGSLGMSSAALYAGIPQLALSQHDEGLVNGRSLRLSRTGLAAPLVNCNPERIAELVRTAYRNAEMRDNALALSERYAAFRDGDPAAKAADIILRLAGKG
jgi:UDP:flavonoid glycosyltransferase YjiC (YdhE family)